MKEPSLLFIFASSFVVALSGAVSPGPLFVVTIAKSLKEGIKAPFYVTGAHAVLEMGMLGLLLWGAGRVMNKPLVVSLIGIVGGAVLLWMGYSMFGKESAEDQSRDVKGRSSFLAGGIATLSNPYWFIWWATVGFNFLVMGLKRGFIGVMVFFIGHILADFVWYFIVGATTTSGKRTLMKYSRLIMQISGVLIGIMGLYFIWGGLKTVF